MVRRRDPNPGGRVRNWAALAVWLLLPCAAPAQPAAGETGLAFYPVIPCRIVDTRVGFGYSGAFGPPSLPGDDTRDIPVLSSSCAGEIPTTVQAYVLNLTVVPRAPTSLTVWPAGQPQPAVATLNSFDGAVVANAAIVAAGGGLFGPGSISVHASGATELVIDINGYFAPPNNQGLAFYPTTPCRLSDTRIGSGGLGGPALAGREARDLPVLSSPCGIPSTAQAYSLNVTVVPRGPLIYLSAWPAGHDQPMVSTLNAFDGRVVANAAIIPAGTNGAISVYVSDPSDVVIDINGYFAPPGQPGAMYFSPAAPCRVADTRNGSGFPDPFGPPALRARATRTFPIVSSTCGIPAAAEAFWLNLTAVAAVPLTSLTTWAADQPQPLASTLNSFLAKPVTNAAVVPAGSGGAIAIYVSDATDVVIDANGYFVPICCSTGISSVQVTGTTPTQAVLTYRAPSLAACTIAVSTSPSYSPVVYDVDENKFSGSSSDARPGNLTQDRLRTFVLGKRRADVASDGKRYSRALQANTLHYYRVTCGSGSATGTFSTANIPFGQTYPLVPPVDRARPGQYAWPTLDDTPRANRAGYVPNESAIDPQTGLKQYRMTLRGDISPGVTTRDFVTGATCREVDGGSAWTAPANACLNTTGQYASTGSAGNYLLLRQNAMSFGAFLYGIQVNLTGFGSDSSAANRTVGICFSNVGMTCSTAAQNAVLPQSSESVVTAPASGHSLNTDWAATSYFVSPFAYAYTNTPSGTVNTTDDATGSTVTWVSGSYFPDVLSAGSGILVGGTEYTITAILDGRTLKAGANLGAQMGAAYSAPVFGILLWKTTGTGTIGVRHVTFTANYDSGVSWPATGHGYECSPHTIADGNGLAGRYCITAGGSYLYWIAESTGESRFISRVLSPGWSVGGTVYWGSSTGCGTTYNLWDASDPTAFYCNFSGASGKSSLARMQINYPSIAPVKPTPNTYLGNCGNSSPPCWNVTVLGSGFNVSANDMTTRMHEFDGTFDPSLFRCAPLITQSHYILVQCQLGTQDSIGWFGVWDLNFDPVAQNPIVAAVPGYAKGANRWCTNHAGFGPIGSPNLLMVSVQNGVGGGAAGVGPWVSYYVSGDLSTSLIPCPANSLDPAAAGHNRCSTVVVDGEPCKKGFNAPERANCPTFGRNGDFYLQDAAPGDIFFLADAQGHSEKVALLARNRQTWTVERGWLGATVRDFTSSTGVQFSADCKSWSLFPLSSGWWWDFIADPHGDANVADPQPVGHAAFSADVTVGGTLPAFCPGYANDPICYNVRQLSTLSALSAVYGYAGASPFAGKMGEGYENAVESHVSTIGGATWLDARPYYATGEPLLNGPGTPFSRVTGTLYKAPRPPNGQTPLTSVLKILPAYAACGRFPLVDVSGPGSSITGDAAGAYQYCVANKAGECFAGSAAGEVYANCPLATKLTCSGANGDRDICFTAAGSNSGVISQYWFSKTNDHAGRYQRVLTSAFQGYRQFYAFWNAKYSSPQEDALLSLSQDYMVPGQWNVFLGSVPPYNNVDSQARNTFLPVTVNLPPPAGVPADNAVVEFGYAENGAAESLYCTSRQEACVAASDTVDSANPFYWASESFHGMPCANGCTIVVPGISGRVVYYRWKLRDASGNVISTGALQAAVTK